MWKSIWQDWYQWWVMCDMGCYDKGICATRYPVTTYIEECQRLYGDLLGVYYNMQIPMNQWFHTMECKKAHANEQIRRAEYLLREVGHKASIYEAKRNDYRATKEANYGEMSYIRNNPYVYYTTNDEGESIRHEEVDWSAYCAAERRAEEAAAGERQYQRKLDYAMQVDRQLRETISQLKNLVRGIEYNMNIVQDCLQKVKRLMKKHGKK